MKNLKKSGSKKIFICNSVKYLKFLKPLMKFRVTLKQQKTSLHGTMFLRLSLACLWQFSRQIFCEGSGKIL